MWNGIKDKAATVASTVVIWGVIIFLGIAASGCSGEITARTAFYRENENGGEVWKSRQANPSQPVSWTWGEAGQSSK